MIFGYFSISLFSKLWKLKIDQIILKTSSKIIFDFCTLFCNTRYVQSLVHCLWKIEVEFVSCWCVKVV